VERSVIEELELSVESAVDVAEDHAVGEIPVPDDPVLVVEAQRRKPAADEGDLRLA
jgi:hypothetical protein